MTHGTVAKTYLEPARMSASETLILGNAATIFHGSSLSPALDIDIIPHEQTVVVPPIKT